MFFQTIEEWIGLTIVLYIVGGVLVLELLNIIRNLMPHVYMESKQRKLIINQLNIKGLYFIIFCIWPIMGALSLFKNRKGGVK